MVLKISNQTFSNFCEHLSHLVLVNLQFRTCAAHKLASFFFFFSNVCGLLKYLLTTSWKGDVNLNNFLTEKEKLYLDIIAHGPLINLATFFFFLFLKHDMIWQFCAWATHKFSTSIICMLGGGRAMHCGLVVGRIVDNWYGIIIRDFFLCLKKLVIFFYQ